MTALLPSRTAPSFDAPAVVSVVARSNTGKTTLIESLIPEIQSLGLSVGVLKHHERPTLFDLPRKDTSRASEAGADVVVGVSPVQVATFQAVREPDLDEILKSSFNQVDIVLTEGHKSGNYPKIEVFRAERSSELLCPEEGLLAVVTDTELPIDVPQFGLDDASGIAAYLVAWLQAPEITWRRKNAPTLDRLQPRRVAQRGSIDRVHQSETRTGCFNRPPRNRQH